MTIDKHRVKGPAHSNVAPSHDDAPSELGGWRLVELLGRGGMGEVWRAERENNAGVRRRAAIKRILPSLRTDALLRERFLSEARTSARLEHPNIVQVLDFGDAPEPYLVFEFVEGVTAGDVLREVSTAGKRIPAVAAVFVAAEVATGLDYAHRKRDDAGRPLDIVHRDVSPHNVLISLDGAVKITDFGVARARDNSIKTAAGMSVGKLVYMAPEQASGQPIDARADVFSLGVALWEMLTCKPLLPRNDPAAALQALMRCDFQPPSAVASHLPPALDAVVLGALGRDPAQRYASAGAFAQALRGLLHSLSPGFASPDLARMLAQLMPGVRFHASVPPPAQPAGVSARYPAASPAAVMAMPAMAMPAMPAPGPSMGPGGGPAYTGVSGALSSSPPGAAPPMAPAPGPGLAAPGPAISGVRRSSGVQPEIAPYGPPASAVVASSTYQPAGATVFEASLRPKNTGRVLLFVALIAVPLLAIVSVGAVFAYRASSERGSDERAPANAASGAATPRASAPAVPTIPPIPTVPTVPTVPMLPAIPSMPPVPASAAPVSAPVDPSGAAAPGAVPTASETAVPTAALAAASSNGSALPPVPTAALVVAPAAPLIAGDAGAVARDGHRSRRSQPVGLVNMAGSDGTQVLQQILRSHRDDVQACTGARAGSGDRVEVSVTLDTTSGQWTHFEVKSDDLALSTDSQRCVMMSLGSLQLPAAGEVTARQRFTF